MKRIVAGAALVWVLGCDSARFVEVAPRGLDFEVAFPVVGDRTGKAELVLPPISIENGVITTGSTKISLDLDRQSVFLIGVDLDALAEADPQLMRARQAEIALAIGAPPVARQTKVGPNASVLSDQKIPGALAMFVLDESSGMPRFRAIDEVVRAVISESLTLTTPIDLEVCGQGSGSVMETFAAQAEVLGTTPTTEIDLDHLLRVDEDRLLALARSPGTAYLFRRSDPRGEPSSVLGLTALMDDHYTIANGIALDRSAQADGSLRVLIAGRVHTCLGSEECEHGAVIEMRLTADRLEFVGTATFTPERPILDVAFDRERRAIAVGAKGMVLAGGPGRLDFEVMESPPVVDVTRADLWRVHATESARDPHWIGGEYRHYLGDAIAGRWAVSTIEAELNEKLRFISLAEAPAEVRGEVGELWTIGEPRGIYRKRIGQEFESVWLPLSPRYVRCTTGDVGESIDYRSVAARGEYVYIAGGCAAILRVRRSDLCTSIIELPGRELTPDLPVPLSTHIYGDTLTVAGKGTIWQLDIGED